jgi:hypothetical protein
MARPALALLLLPLLACKTGSSNTLAGAAATTGVAMGAAVASRAAGGCVAICTGETFCNQRTGLCDALPCSGKCGAGEKCAQTLTDIRCVPEGTPAVETRAAAAKNTKVPAVVPVTSSPNASTGSPTIVPAAEQQAK